MTGGDAGGASLERMDDSPIVVVTYGGTVHGLDSKTGAPVWQHTLGDYDRSDTIEVNVVDGLVLAYIDTPNVLWCLDYATGAVQGQVKLPFTVGGRPIMLVTDEGIVIAKHSEVACLDRRGQLRWHRRLSDDFKQGGTALAVPGQSRQADLVD